MGLTLYLPKEKEFGFRLLETIKKAVPGHMIEICSSLGELSERLHQPVWDIGVAVLCASDSTELMELVYLGDLLGELRVVLVLPDNQPEILEKACSLRPRFIAAEEKDFKHLGSVLKRMMDLYDKAHWV